MRQSLLKGLTEEQVKKIEACNSTEEILKIAKNECIELTEEQLGAVTGGCLGEALRVCPMCGCTDSDAVNTYGEYGLDYFYVCKGCGYRFTDADL